jgi:S4 domain protein YaaA
MRKRRSWSEDPVQIVKIDTPYITLGQLLKVLDVIQTGGQAKWFLAEHIVKVNGEQENRRGRKIYPQDIVEIDGLEPVRVVAD